MPPNRKSKVRRILLISANPKDTPPLRLDQEFRQITDALKRSLKRNEFDIRTEPAVTDRHIRQAILEYKPQIVHFCGHGAGADGIACLDESGSVKLIPTSALAGLFALAAKHVRCVVLNACYAEAQADEIVKHIECVVGMRHSISDQAALRFAEGFYDALGVGEPFEECFRWGKSAVEMEGESVPEGSTPVFKKKDAPPAPAPSPAHKTPPRPGGPKPAPPTHITETKSRKELLAAVLLTAVVVALATWAATRWWYTSHRIVGRYTQRDFDPPERSKKGLPFQVHSVASSLVFYINPATGKLNASEISTNLISYIQQRDKPDEKVLPLAMYTAHWQYEEVERVGPNYLRMRAQPLSRIAFDSLGFLLKDTKVNAGGEFNLYLEEIKAAYPKANSDIKLSPDGSILERTNVYQPNKSETDTFNRDGDQQQ